MTRSPLSARAARLSRRLIVAQSGTSLVEFALVFPLLISVSGGGLELANYTILRRQISDLAGQIADNASRVGSRTELQTTQLREVDINDVFAGAQLQAGPIDLKKNGRVILSSLERNADGGQWIHWQRCYGEKSHASSYGLQDAGKTGTSFPGMGPASARVKASAKTGVMFVEIAFTYKAIVPFGSNVFGDIKERSSFAVRDNRDYSRVYNPSPAAPVSTCS